MATLTGQSIASSYEQLLHVDTDGGGNTTTLVPIKDGDNGTTFCLQLSTTKAMIEGNGSTLYFYDEGGESISADNAGVLSIAAGAEIDLTATAVDLNGTLDVSGTLTVGADGSGTDVIFYSGTAGDNFTWDASEECLIITGTDAAQALKVADGDLVVVDKIYLYDNDGGEYISGDGTDLTIAAGTALNITADVIDLSDATKDVTLNAAVDALNFDSNTLSIDASNNRVGIGTAAPATILEVESGSPIVTIGDTGNNYAADAVQSVIHLSGRYYSGTADPGADAYSDARIVLRKDSGDGTGGAALCFETSATGAGGPKSKDDLCIACLGAGSWKPHALHVSFITRVPTDNASDVSFNMHACPRARAPKYCINTFNACAAVIRQCAV